MRTLVDGFRKIVRHRRWIQGPGIVLALLLIVLAFLAWYGNGEVRKCDLIVFNSPIRAHTLPRLLEVYRMPILTDTSVYSGDAAVVLQSYSRLLQITIEYLFCYCCHNTNHSTIFNARSIALATLQLKTPSKLKYMDRIHYFRKTLVLVI